MNWMELNCGTQGVKSQQKITFNSGNHDWSGSEDEVVGMQYLHTRQYNTEFCSSVIISR